MEQRAEGNARDQALIESFEPVALDAGELRVRPLAASASYAAARVDQLAALARAAAGAPIRVAMDKRDSPAPQPRALPSAAADDEVRTHPLVRQVAELFDATIVRVEAAGTLPAARAHAEGAGETDTDSSGDEHV